MSKLFLNLLRLVSTCLLYVWKVPSFPFKRRRVKRLSIKDECTFEIFYIHDTTNSLYKETFYELNVIKFHKDVYGKI